MFRRSLNRETNKLVKKKKIGVDIFIEDQKEFANDKIILRTQQIFKSERHNVFTEVINKIALS